MSNSCENSNFLSPIIAKKRICKNIPKNKFNKNTIPQKTNNEISQKFEICINSETNRKNFNYRNYINQTFLKNKRQELQKNIKNTNSKFKNSLKQFLNKRSWDNLYRKRSKINKNKVKIINYKRKLIARSFSLSVLLRRNLRRNNTKFYKKENTDIHINTKKSKHINNFYFVTGINKINKINGSNNIYINTLKNNESKSKNLRLNSFNIKKLDINKEYIKKNKTRKNNIDINSIENYFYIINNYNNKKEKLSLKSNKKINSKRINYKNNKYKLNIELEKKQLSLDLLKNNDNIKNFTNIHTLVNMKFNKYTNTEPNYLINPYKEISKNNKKEEQKISEELTNYNFITENEQDIDEGINVIKTNNYKINKPKEENLKFSALNEEKISETSKIIIGQIDGYKDIIEKDKSKSIIEVLSKASFSYIKNNNNKQSLENGDNNVKNILGDFMSNNSKEINNITNIKNVEDDYDSEDLSNIIRNNIKNINKHKKKYMNKGKIKLKYRSNLKTNMNTNNTTISSKNKINDNNIKISNKKERNERLRTKSNNLNEILSLNSTKISNLDRKANTKRKGDKYVKNKVIILNKNEVRNNIVLSKKADNIKSIKNRYKNINTNIIFNSPKKKKKPPMVVCFNNNKNSPNNKHFTKPKEENNISLSNKEKNLKNQNIRNNIVINNIMNGENETIVNSCFSATENDICKNNYDEYNNKSNKVINQCILI